MSSRHPSKKLKTSAIRTTDELHEKRGFGKWQSLDGDDDLTFRERDVINRRRYRKASLTLGVAGQQTRLAADGRYELPFVDIEADERVDYQRKFDMFNSMLDQDARVGQTRRQHQYYVHSGVSEDSDYTSDVNYPIGQGQQGPPGSGRPNSSASYHHYGTSSSGTHRHHHSHHMSHHRSSLHHRQLATPQRSLNSSRENSYEKDDDYRPNGQSSYYPPAAVPVPPAPSSIASSSSRRRLPQTLGLSTSHSQQQSSQFYATQSSHSRKFPPSHSGASNQLHPGEEEEEEGELIEEGDQTGEEYWDDNVRDYETEPLYYNSRPQSYKPYSAYRRHDSWDDGYNSYRKEDSSSYSRQYSDDYDEDAQDYCQPSHNYSKRLKNNRRGTYSLERQDTLYHDDIPGDYHVDADDSNSRLYDNDRYSSTSASRNQQQQQHEQQYHRQHSLQQKDSGYDQYSLDYGDYGEDTSFYGNDDSTIPQASASSTIDHYEDQYEDDNRYSYESQDWNCAEADNRDHYSTTSSTSKSHKKKLPQIPPVQKSHSFRTDSYSEDAYLDANAYDDGYGIAATTSTTDDAYYSNKEYEDYDDATPTVPEPPSTTTVPVVATSSTSHPSSYQPEKLQQYTTSQHYSSHPQENLYQNQNQQHQQTQQQATPKHQQQQSYPAHPNHPHSEQQHLGDQEQSQDYYDSSVPYENQTGYEESWDYNGYYDEAGNFIPYDTTSYYDESGNLVTTGQGQYDSSAYYDDTTAVTATVAATNTAADQTYPQTVPTSTQQEIQPHHQSTAANDQQYHGNYSKSSQQIDNSQQEQSFDQYDNTDYYYSGGAQDYGYDDYYGYEEGKVEYGSYDAGDYMDETMGGYHQYDQNETSGVDTVATTTTTTTAATAANHYTTSKPSQFQSSNNNTPNKKSQLHSLQSQSSVEYNYAYQSAENLSSSLTYEDAVSQANKTSSTVTTMVTTTTTGTATGLSSLSHLDRANSQTRRASFRRQVTRDYGLDGGPETHSQSFDAPTHPLDHDPHAANNASNEKSETFRNGIKVTVQDTVDLGLGYSMSMEDDSYNPDSNWRDGYDYGNEDWKSSEDWNKSEDDRRYDDQKSHESQEQGYETQDGSRTDNGPIHMDSLESNASDQAARDPEAQEQFEAQYWAKQKERIAKQATLTAQDSFGYDYGLGNVAGSGAAFFEPVVDDSIINDQNAGMVDQVDNHHPALSRMHSTEDWTGSGQGSKKNSLDVEQDEWLGGGMDRQGSQRSRRGSSANLMINRQESVALDTHPEEDDEYLIGGPPGSDDRIGRKVSTDSAGLTETAAKLAMLNEIQDDSMIMLEEQAGDRKSSLEVAKDKAAKSVSFDEEPPKMLAPERQTKGMTPREKWLWGINRICSQLAVSESHANFLA